MVKLTGASLELRTLKVTRPLLKQMRILTSIPKKFRIDPLTPDQRAELEALNESAVGEQRTRRDELQRIDSAADTRLDPAKCVGWFAGEVLGAEYTRYVLFVNDGDAYLFNWPGFKPEPWCKQIYIQ